MEQQRVWLSEWEWACCGEPFEVGDEVAFRTAPRSEGLTALLGLELARSIDRQESHHSDPPEERVRGIVVAIWAVVSEYSERRMPRLAPPGWPPITAHGPESGAGSVVMQGSGRPYTIVREVIPGSARLSTLSRVPWPPRESEPIFAGQRLDGLAGYLVDLELG